MKLIVEMELPCKIYYLGGLHGTPTCPIERRICKDQKNPPKWCPIKGVLPDEHGDLIDRDKLKHAFCNHCDGRDTINGEPNCKEPCFDIGIMDCMPVIIAAERKDDEQIH